MDESSVGNLEMVKTIWTHHPEKLHKVYAKIDVLMKARSLAAPPKQQQKTNPFVFFRELPEECESDESDDDTEFVQARQKHTIVFNN